MKNTYESNSAKAARQPLLESAADSQQFAGAECAAINALDYIRDIKTALFTKGHNVWWLVRYADDIHEFTFVTLADSEEDACHNLEGYCGKLNRYDIDVLYVTPLTRVELARYGTSEAVKTDVKSVLDNLKDENFAPAEFCI